ncbi:MAG: response regulator [Chloroflexi bacterium]|nr:response regulator [Chloroflexota bacterium]
MLSIVVIDDDAGIRGALRRVLGAAAYKVFTAASTDDGLTAIQQHRPDLVLLDVRMPHKSGIQLLEDLKRLGVSARVVMLTGMGEPDVMKACQELGAVDFLMKPISPDYLLKVVALRIAQPLGGSSSTTLPRGA